MVNVGPWLSVELFSVMVSVRAWVSVMESVRSHGFFCSAIYVQYSVSGQQKPANTAQMGLCCPHI